MTTAIAGESCACGHYVSTRHPDLPEHSVLRCQVCPQEWTEPDWPHGAIACLACHTKGLYWLAHYCARCRLLWCAQCGVYPYMPLGAGKTHKRDGFPSEYCMNWKGDHELYCTCGEFIGTKRCDCREFERRHGYDRVRPGNTSARIRKGWRDN